jgi:hypothetical protein
MEPSSCRHSHRCAARRPCAAARAACSAARSSSTSSRSAYGSSARTIAAGRPGRVLDGRLRGDSNEATRGAVILQCRSGGCKRTSRSTTAAITTLAGKGLPDLVIQAHVGHVAAGDDEHLQRHSPGSAEPGCRCARSTRLSHSSRRRRMLPPLKTSCVTTHVTKAGRARAGARFCEEKYLAALDDFRNWLIREAA